MSTRTVHPAYRPTVVFEREGTAVVIKGVPARICANCGEEYVDELVTRELLQTASAAAAAGVQVEVREYVAA